MKIEELYTDLWQELLAYCGQMTGGSRAAAEDIVQESFLRALQNAHLIDEMDRPHCRAWLYKTARNIFIDRARRAAAENARLAVLGWEEACEDNAFSEAEAAVLLLLLPEELRTLFRMRYIEGYNAAELGEIFDMNPSTLRSKLSAAKKILRKELSQKWEDKNEKG